MAAERAAKRITGSHQSAVDKHVGTVANAVEHQQHMLRTAEVRQREVTAIPPRTLEGLGVVLPIGQPLEDALVESVARQRAHDRRRHLGVIRFLSDRTLYTPPVSQQLLGGANLHSGQ